MKKKKETQIEWKLQNGLKISQDLARKEKNPDDSTSFLEIPIEENDSIDFSSYHFGKFAATYFASNMTPQYSKRPLKQALLDLPLPADQMVRR